MTNLFDLPPSDDNDPFPNVEESLSGNPRTEARLCAIQVVFQSMASEDGIPEIKESFRRNELGPRSANIPLFTALVDDLNLGMERYVEMIGANLAMDWTYERLPLVERSILLAAVSELSSQPETPVNVIINEYLNISKGFLDEAKVGFINGMLDVAAHKLRGIPLIDGEGASSSEE